MKGVHDALRRLEGVGSIQVDLQTNLVVLVPDSNVELDLAAIPRAIRGAGFTPADMELVALGTFGSSDGSPTFRIRGWRRELRVRAGGALPQEETRVHAKVDFAGDDLILEPLRE